jgi:hypothetical protein
VASGGGDKTSRVSRDDGEGVFRQGERSMTASSGIDSRSMTLARSPAPSIAQPPAVAGASQMGDSQSEYLSKVSGRSMSRMGTQV